MIMGPNYKCSSCGKANDPLVWSDRKEDHLCIECVRLYHPPRMTLIKFNQGSYNRLWNLEIGVYEEFSDVEDIDCCDWFVRSKQETLYSIVPKVQATIYHMEYFGEAVCGRCVDYPFFEDSETCISQACEKAAKPHRPESEIQYPKERSKYIQWIQKLEGTSPVQ